MRPDATNAPHRHKHAHAHIPLSSYCAVEVQVEPATCIFLSHAHRHRRHGKHTRAHSSYVSRSTPWTPMKNRLSLSMRVKTPKQHGRTHAHARAQPRPLTRGVEKRHLRASTTRVPSAQTKRTANSTAKSGALTTCFGPVTVRRCCYSQPRFRRQKQNTPRQKKREVINQHNQHPAPSG